MRNQTDHVQQSLDLCQSLKTLWFSGQGDITPDQAIEQHNARMEAYAETLFDPIPLDIEV